MLYIKLLLAGLMMGAAFQQAPHSEAYRVIGKEKFKIVDTAGFYIYSINKLVQGEKIARAETVYYFSSRPEGTLHELTRTNLENVFSPNAKFRYELEKTFRSDKALMEYDHYLGEYKVKYLYLQSIHG